VRGAAAENVHSAAKESAPGSAAVEQPAHLAAPGNLPDGTALDIETASEHQINVQVTDSAGNSYEKPVTIQAQDVPENLAPDAVDDVGFVASNATLLGEMSFDTGTPAAHLGSISTASAGQVGNAADFNAAKVELSGLNLNADPGAQTTVSMWVQTDPAGNWEMLTASDRYDLVTLDGNIGFNTARGDLFGADASTLADGQWHQVVATFTNGDVSSNSLYIDGQKLSLSQIQGTPSNAAANIATDGGTLHFGSWGANSNYRFTGAMDEVKVFNGSINDAQAGQLYQIESDHNHWADTSGLSTDEQTPITVDVLANDHDAEGDTLSLTHVGTVTDSFGVVVGRAEIVDNKIEFTPNDQLAGLNAGETLPVSFNYSVSDGHGGQATATAAINVTGIGSGGSLTGITLVGTPNVDHLVGTERGDHLSGLDGNDVLIGGAGNDVLDGGAGNDQLLGGDGNDALSGGLGTDRLVGGNGNDTLDGGAGNDSLSGGAGSDRLYAGAGDDILNGGSGLDRAYGGDGNDAYDFNPFDGSDYFDGGAGGGWTDVIQLDATADPNADPSNPWSIQIDGVQVQYDLAANALDVGPDASGSVTLADGSELTFAGVERFEW